MKNLPIKLFEKRKMIDDRNPEGGGSSTLPPWARLSQGELAARVNSFLGVLEATSDWLMHRSTSEDFIPAIIKLEINELALAKSHRQSITTLFSDSDQYNVIGFADNTDLLVKVNSRAEVELIKRKVRNTERNQKGIAAITAMARFSPDISIRETTTNITPLRASLINFQDFQLNEAVSRAFENRCERNNITFKKANYSPELIVYRLGNVTTDSLSNIENFGALAALTEMPTYGVGTDSLMTAGDETIAIKIPDPAKQYPTVGVLDGGIEAIPALSPWLSQDSYSKVPEDLKDKAHGTFVAGRILYGDQLDGILPSGLEGCYLFDAAIFPDRSKDVIEENDLVDNIRGAIKSNKEIKIWNLSIGTKIESDKHTFSLIGMALDEIQLENQVLICKSAGNCSNYEHGYPVQRISKSADSALSLVVGSLAHKKNSFDLAEPHYPSPFSRIGHGPSFLNKPDLTHYGGNAGIHPISGHALHTGVKSFKIDGTLGEYVGTSFSTPRVTAIIAGLHNSLNESFNPLLLKCLAIHSAKYPINVSLPPDQRLKTMGYGIPDTVDNILYNDENEITLVLQDTLEKGHWIQMLDFPFPEELQENGRYYGEIVVTLASQPMFSETQGGEYCQSNIEVRFGTHEGMRSRERSVNPLSHQDGHNILRGALYRTGYRNATSGPFVQERTLIQYGDKFHPIKKYAINLEEMTTGNIDRYLTVPKYWYLEIEGLFRDFISNRAVEDGLILSQEYCLIVTIRDNRKRHNVYDSVANQLSARGFFHNNINLRNNITIPVTS